MVCNNTHLEMDSQLGSYNLAIHEEGEWHVVVCTIAETFLQQYQYHPSKSTNKSLYPCDHLSHMHTAVYSLNICIGIIKYCFNEYEYLFISRLMVY